tara:strand:+ start:933 stop:1043 length:111 start_codon:yes stop_codon:yes gene_type:complete
MDRTTLYEFTAAEMIVLFVQEETLLHDEEHVAYFMP